MYMYVVDGDGDAGSCHGGDIGGSCHYGVPSQESVDHIIVYGQPSTTTTVVPWALTYWAQRLSASPSNPSSCRSSVSADLAQVYLLT